MEKSVVSFHYLEILNTAQNHPYFPSEKKARAYDVMILMVWGWDGMGRTHYDSNFDFDFDEGKGDGVGG